MQITQKHLNITHTYTFHERHLNCAYKDRTGAADVDVRYQDIPKEGMKRLEETAWLSAVGFVVIALGLLGMATGPAWGVLIVVGAGLVIARYRLRVTYSVFQTDQGSVWIIHDDLYDEVLREVMSRRKQQLLAEYGEINPENELPFEVRKFRWLCEEEVITREEMDQKIAQLRIEKQLQLHRPGPYPS